MDTFQIRLRKQPGTVPAWRPVDYDVLLNGTKVGEVYSNMTGYVSTLPLPSSGQFDPGEGSISAFRREIACINREAKAALEVDLCPHCGAGAEVYDSRSCENCGNYRNAEIQAYCRGDKTVNGLNVSSYSP